MSGELKFDELEMEAFGFQDIPQEVEEVEDIDNKDTDQEEITKETTEEVEVPLNEEEPEEKVGVDDNKEGGEPDSETDGSSSPSLYSSLAKVLAEEGLLPSLKEDKEVKTVDDLVEAFRAEIKNNEFAGLTDKQKAYLQGLQNGIPEEEVKEHINIETQLSSITPEEIKSNENLRRQVILNGFKLKGYTEEKAQKLTQRSFDIGEDESDALDELDGLKVYYQQEYDKKIQLAEQAKLDAQKKSEEQLDSLRKTITEFKEVIPGLKISEKDKTKIFEMATKPVAQLEDGRRINAIMQAKLADPINFEAKLNYLFYITDQFKNFDIIKKTQKTKVVKELDDFVKGNTFVATGSQSTSNLDFDPYKSGFSNDIINNIK